MQLQFLLQHSKHNYNSITIMKTQLQFYYNYQIPITILLQHPNPNYNSITTIKSQLQLLLRFLKAIYNFITTPQSQLQYNYNIPMLNYNNHASFTI